MRSFSAYIVITFLILGWWVANGTCHAEGKLFLKGASYLAFPLPLAVVTLSSAELLAGAIGACLMQGFRGRTMASLSASIFHGGVRRPLALTGMAFLTALGVFATNASMGVGTAFFTQIVKAAEPLTTVLLLRLLYKEHHGWAIHASLLVTVTGVVIASAKKGNSTAGITALLFALLSNVSFSSRNVLSKWAGLGGSSDENALDAIDILSIVTVGGSIVSFSSWLPWVSSIEEYSRYVDWPASNLALASLSFFLYHVLSFAVLQRVGVLAHAVANALKRSFVVVAMAIVFGVPLTINNAGGAGTTILGCVLYGWANVVRKRKQMAEKEAAQEKSEQA